MQAAAEKARILVEALPYIRAFYGKTVVIKYGGNAMTSETLKDEVVQDLALMKYVGIRPIIVHGGGPEITALLKRLGKETTFVEGLRVTDAETVTTAEMVLAGKINADIVTRLCLQGASAVGLSGKDANLLRARKKQVLVQGKAVDIGFVGEVEAVNTQILETLLQSDYLPVVAPIGADGVGQSYNINADYVAAALAGALQAEKLILLTDIEGIYKDYADKTSFLPTITVREAQQYLKDGTLQGGMLPKVEACLMALSQGARKAHIIDGRQEHSLILELFTSQGIGTQIIPEA